MEEKKKEENYDWFAPQKIIRPRAGMMVCRRSTLLTIFGSAWQEEAKKNVKNAALKLLGREEGSRDFLKALTELAVEMSAWVAHANCTGVTALSTWCHKAANEALEEAGSDYRVLFRMRWGEPVSETYLRDKRFCLYMVELK